MRFLCSTSAGAARTISRGSHPPNNFAACANTGAAVGALLVRENMRECCSPCPEHRMARVIGRPSRRIEDQGSPPQGCNAYKRARDDHGACLCEGHFVGDSKQNPEKSRWQG